jgi:hypothetical protein
MADFFNLKFGHNPEKNLTFENNSREVMTGQDFLKKNQISWPAWVYFFRRDFLIQHNLLFRENAGFTDTDFSIKSIFLAEKIKYKKSFFLII